MKVGVIIDDEGKGSTMLPSGDGETTDAIAIKTEVRLGHLDCTELLGARTRGRTFMSVTSKNRHSVIVVCNYCGATAIAQRAIMKTALLGVINSINGDDHGKKKHSRSVEIVLANRNQADFIRRMHRYPPI